MHGCRQEQEYLEYYMDSLLYFRTAIDNSPEEEESGGEKEEQRKLLEARSVKLRELTGKLLKGLSINYVIHVSVIFDPPPLPPKMIT